MHLPLLVMQLQTPGILLISPKQSVNGSLFQNISIYVFVNWNWSPGNWRAIIRINWFVSCLLWQLTYFAGKTTLPVLIFLKTASPRAWKGGTPTNMLKVRIPRAHLKKRAGYRFLERLPVHGSTVLPVKEYFRGHETWGTTERAGCFPLIANLHVLRKVSVTHTRCNSMETFLHMPKSVSLVWPSLVSITFSGLMSRWR